MTRSSVRKATPEPAGVETPNDVSPESKMDVTLPTPTKPTENNGSDSESGERDARDKLKKTAIASILNEDASSRPSDSGSEAGDEVKHPAATSDTVVKKDEDGQRGRLGKKRSFEDLEADNVTDSHVEKSNNRHVRKRSRDVRTVSMDKEMWLRRTAGEKPVQEEDEVLQDQPTADVPDKSDASDEVKRLTPQEDSDIMVEDAAKEPSPKGKRSREEYQKDQEDAPVEQKAKDVPSKDAEIVTTNNTAEEPEKTEETEPKTKRHRDSSSPQPSEPAEMKEAEAPTTKIPPTSGFANTSTSSPFASLGSPDATSTLPQTSSTAFASSGFGALAGSTSSPFGALGSSGSKSAFGAARAKSPPTAATTDFKPPASGFGNVSANSPFASLGSGSAFGGKLGAGFGGGFGALGGSKLSSFASSAGAGSAGAGGPGEKAAKPFGAPADEDEEEGSGAEDDEEEKASKALSPEPEQVDKRFYEQEVETGEEGWDLVWSGRAKLYNYAETDDGKKEWKERGVGTLTLRSLVEEDGEEGSAKLKARLIMRADGIKRVILNSPITKEILFGDSEGNKPERQIVFTGFHEGVMQLLTLKLRKENAQELYSRVKELQAEM